MANELPKDPVGTGEERRAREAAFRRALLLPMVVAFLGGVVFILYANRFRVSTPVVMMSLAWLAVLATVRYLLGAAWAIANDGGDDEYFRPVGKREELLAEKRSLLKAIKEIEFDRAMNKMSDKDASELTGYYRVQAIEVIKQLEQLDTAQPDTIRAEIEREVRARVAIEKEADKARAKSKKRRKKNNNKRDSTDAKRESHAGRPEPLREEA